MLRLYGASVSTPSGTSTLFTSLTSIAGNEPKVHVEMISKVSSFIKSPTGRFSYDLFFKLLYPSGNTKHEAPPSRVIESLSFIFVFTLFTHITLSAPIVTHSSSDSSGTTSCFIPS